MTSSEDRANPSVDVDRVASLFGVPGELLGWQRDVLLGAFPRGQLEVTDGRAYYEHAASVVHPPERHDPLGWGHWYQAGFVEDGDDLREIGGEVRVDPVDVRIGFANRVTFRMDFAAAPRPDDTWSPLDASDNPAQTWDEMMWEHTDAMRWTPDMDHL